MHEQGKTDIPKRIRAWKANCVSNDLSYKEVIVSVNMNYDSVINAMNSALKGNTVAISDKKMRILEKAMAVLTIKKHL
ncbi:MAG: hypothetical protein BalsKO_09960 [Balneolaceae bacterium]